MTDARIEVLDDPAELATSVAGALLRRLADIQADGRVPHVALTGGTIAREIHREVARLSADTVVDWSRVVLWWGDERFVPADDPERNAGQAYDDLLDHVGVDPANVHVMPHSNAGLSLDEAAAAYEQELRAAGAGEFDVMMLGLGPDGHCASLFPGAPEVAVTDRIAVPVRSSPKPPPERISLTLPALNRSNSVWWLVSGESKAEAAAAAMADGEITQIPARGVRGSAETAWFLDASAASRL